MAYKFNPLTGQFDLVDGISASSLNNYSQTFSIANWVLDVNTYKLTVLKTTHGKNSPIVSVYEVSGTDFIEVETGVKIDASENITLTVNATPDLRFNGKISIS